MLFQLGLSPAKNGLVVEGKRISPYVNILAVKGRYADDPAYSGTCQKLLPAQKVKDYIAEENIQNCGSKVALLSI